MSNRKERVNLYWWRERTEQANEQASKKEIYHVVYIMYSLALRKFFVFIPIQSVTYVCIETGRMAHS